MIQKGGIPYSHVVGQPHPNIFNPAHPRKLTCLINLNPKLPLNPPHNIMSNLTQSDLHFLSSTQPSLSSVLSTLRRSNLTIHNRLRSCLADAEFVLRVRAAFNKPSAEADSRGEAEDGEEPAGPGRPLIANERCGSWYIRPRDKGGSAYFKSTDGHERAWKFSTRRLNMHLVELIERCDGVIIVDSTRRGKRAYAPFMFSPLYVHSGLRGPRNNFPQELEE